MRTAKPADLLPDRCRFLQRHGRHGAALCSSAYPRRNGGRREGGAESCYGGSIVRYVETADADGFLSAAALSGKDAMEVAVFGSETRILLTARYDNLGKGASGAAVECMNLVLGVDPATGLNL